MQNNYYVYEYIRLDTGEPFYVGKGKGSRWKSKQGRSKYFMSICQNRNVAVVFLEEELDETTAFEYESWYIWHYRDVLGYNLINITDGGEGSSVSRPEHSKLMSGSNNPMAGSARFGEANPFFNKKHSEETRRRISKARKGMAPPNKGQKMSEQQKEKLIKTFAVINSEGQIVKKLRGKKELYGDWRKEYPRPNGINTVSRCLSKGELFHGFKITKI